MAAKPIELHYWPTPNGHKIAIMLEECGLTYEVKPVDIGKGVKRLATPTPHRRPIPTPPWRDESVRLCLYLLMVCNLDGAQPA